MLQLPPGATSPTFNTKEWYKYHLRKTAMSWKRSLSDGKWQSMPAFVFVGIYALIVVCRMLFPEAILGLVIIFAVVGVLSIVFSIYAVDHHAKTEVLMTSIAIGMAFIWIAAAFKFGLEIRVFVSGSILTIILGIPYWRELAKIKNPQKITLEGGLPEAKEVKGEFGDTKWLEGAEWATSRTPTQAGWVQRLQLPEGVDASDFIARRQGGMASVLKVGKDSVELVNVPDRNDMVDVYAHTRGDFIKEPAIWPPILEGKLPRVWDPIPTGLFKSGEVLFTSMVEKHILIAGESGSGKSNELSKEAAVAAYDPTAQLWLFDGKRLELLPWRFAAKGYVQDNIVHAVLMLRAIQAEMNWRYDEMARMPGVVRKAHNSGGVFGPIVVIIDELARYIRDGVQESNLQKEFKSLIFDLGERGRAAGVSLVTAVIKPSGKLFDGTDMRDLFIQRMALRMAGTQGSTMVLGPGQPDASKISQDDRGMFYFFQGQIARLGRGYLVTDEQLDALAQAAPVCEGQWGVFMADDEMPEMIAGDTRQLVSGKGQITSTKFVPKELTMGGATLMEPYSGPTLPDGSPFKDSWHVTLWESIPDDSFVSSRELEKIVGKTRNPVIILLKSWTEMEWLEATIENNTTKWRKKVVDA